MTFILMFHPEGDNPEPMFVVNAKNERAAVKWVTKHAEDLADMTSEDATRYFDDGTLYFEKTEILNAVG